MFYLHSAKELTINKMGLSVNLRSKYEKTLLKWEWSDLKEFFGKITKTTVKCVIQTCSAVRF